ncbi:hypothetical protein FRB98_002522 [Tulasnella sp. 332]|nr:hypothetical protein FRB98_002522 [Tulasnella sp. 332]
MSMADSLQKSGKLPHNTALLFLIAAKAATTTMPNWVSDPVGSWWTTEGLIWVKSLAERLEISYNSLPPHPLGTDIKPLAKMIQEADHTNIILSVLSLCLLPHTPSAEGTTATSPAETSTPTPPLYYTASERAFLTRTLELLDIPYAHLLSAEDDVAQSIYHELKSAEMDSKKAEAARKSKEEGWGGYWGRVAATGVGIVLGGVAIGITGGLAAPAFLPLIPFLTAGSAPMVLGTLFGLTGGGLAGKRVNKRWAGVDKFEFRQITGGGEKNDPGAVVNKETADIPGSEVEKAQAPSLLATIIIPGILLKSETEGIDSVKQCSALFTSPRRDTFVLSQSPSTMLATGKALHNWVSNQLLGRLKGEIIKRTALQTVMGAVTLPITIYKTTGMVVDNEWIRGTDRARKAGQLLAEVLKEKVQGERPVVLVGLSLGALTLFEALLVLSATALPSPLIDTAIFISLPGSPSPTEWSKVRNAVGRRIVNAYCATDLVLAGVGRLHEVLGERRVSTMAGMAPVVREDGKDLGIENVDLGEVIKASLVLKGKPSPPTTGHFELNEKIRSILEVVGVNS